MTRISNRTAGALKASYLPWVLILVGTVLPLPLSAQLPDSTRVRPDSALLDVEEQPASVLVLEEEPSFGITPRGAFIRSAFIPGWGHAKVGAYGRGAFYFLVEAISGFMIVKTHGQVALARDRRALWESVVSERLQVDGPLDPEDLEAALAEDLMVDDLRGLVEARSGQMEDWAALGIFFLFLGGADAYVSAHLSDFPGAVEVNTNEYGAVEVGLSLPVGR